MPTHPFAIDGTEERRRGPGNRIYPTGSSGAAGVFKHRLKADQLHQALPIQWKA